MIRNCVIIGKSYKSYKIRHMWDVPKVEDKNEDEDYLNLMTNDVYR